MHSSNFYNFKTDIEADGVIPTVTDLCAGLQHAIMSHICRKLQRGMLYADITNLIPKEARRLVSQFLKIIFGFPNTIFYRSYLEEWLATSIYAIVLLYCAEKWITNCSARLRNFAPIMEL